MRNLPTALLVLIVALAAVLLAGCPSIATEYVAADRSMYEAVEPEYWAYVESDEALADAQKELRRAMLDAWKLRITEAEKAGD